MEASARSETSLGRVARGASARKNPPSRRGAGFGRELGEYMWDVLLEAGEAYGVVPFGFETLARISRD